MILVLGLTGKVLSSLLAVHHVGHAVADVDTRMRMNLINALPEASVGACSATNTWAACLRRSTMEAQRTSEIGIVMIGSLNRFIVITHRYVRKQTKRTRNLIGRLADVLGGLGTIKAMGRQARFRCSIRRIQGRDGSVDGTHVNEPAYGRNSDCCRPGATGSAGPLIYPRAPTLPVGCRQNETGRTHPGVAQSRRGQILTDGTPIQELDAIKWRLMVG